MTNTTSITSTDAAGESRGDSQLLHRLFEAQVDRRPDAIACIWQGTTYSYAMLDEHANRLARRLRTLGVTQGASVAFHLERSIDTVIAILAILKAGAAYVPLDPEHPIERLRFAIEDSQAVVVVSRRAMWTEASPPASAIFLCLDEARGAIHEEHATRLGNGAGPDDVAYIIYTSGSTGTPKGVAVSHRNVARLFTSTARWFGFGADDVWSLFHSFAFDFSVWEMWGALLYGGRLVIVAYRLSRTPEAMARLIRDDGVTVLCQTPSAFRHLCPAMLSLEGGSRLRYVIFGGEALQFRQLRPWFERFGDERPRCINMFGITETTVHASYRSVTHLDALTESRSCIGVALPDLDIALWDDRDEPVEDGEVGEIVVGGEGVAVGYLGRPELTRERFIERDGRRYYRSGDLARRLSEHDIEYLGRRDGQVKLRGFRIETQEILACLLEHDGVADGVVRLVGEGADARLVAYLVPASGTLPGRADLERLLSRRLPPYMVPSSFVQISSFPLTTNGKLDIAALPAPDMESVDHQEPTTATERFLADAWLRALGGSVRAGRTDGFLALGGDSIGAARVLAELLERRGIELSFREFFGAPTLADLAVLVDSHGAPAVGDAMVSHSAPSSDELTFAEEYFHFLSRLTAGTALYTENLVIRIRDALEIARLQRAVDIVTSRHTALRATYVSDGQGVRRVVATTVEVPVAHHDLRALPEPARRNTLDRLTDARAQTAFDLAVGPLLRVDAYTVADDEHLVLLTFPHIVLDGVGCAIVVRELGAAYAGSALDPAQLGTDVRDVAAWQRARSDEHRTAHLEYWRERLAHADAPVLPADRPRPGERTFRGARLRRPVPARLAEQLRGLARTGNTTLFTTLLGAFIVHLHGHTGATDITVGAIASGRTKSPAQRTVGCFVNPFAIRQEVDPSTSFMTLLADLHDNLLEAQDHAELPFAMVVRELGAADRAGANPIFQMAVSSNVVIHLPCPPWDVSVNALHNGSSRFDLAMQIDMRTDKDLALVLEYSLEIFEPATVGRLVDGFVDLLEAIVRDPASALHDLVRVDDHEAEALIALGRGAPTDGGELVLDRIQRNARRRPDAAAVVCGTTVVTYAELEHWSGAIAAHLQVAGVGLETIVALGTPPSIEWIAGMIGILKAGAAFLTLDPSSPVDRREAIIRDAGVGIVCIVDETRDLFRSFQGWLIDLAALRGRGGAARANPALTRDSLAYVMYTSGSTGAPKGVLLHHDGLANMVDVVLRRLEYSESERVAQLGSPLFDICLLEVFPALATGATVAVAPREARIPGREMSDFLAREGITTLFVVPPTLAALPPVDLPDLQTIVFGGDVLSSDLVKRWSRNRRTYNAYGPTETTIFATMSRCDPADARPSIGTPIAGVHVYVVDAALRLVRSGVAGELLIGGLAVGRGYLGRDELTRQRFLDDPFRPGGRVYRTGDLVRFRPDGELEFLSRSDRQVKIRGFRIELAEIEAALLEESSVAHAVVIVRDDTKRQRCLVAYVVSSGGEAIVPGLRARIAARLPGYMMPSAFVVLESMPLSQSGKVAVDALPVPAWSQEARTTVVTVLEREIAGVWSAILRVDAVSPDDAFFEIGGDSLALARVQSSLQERLGVEVAMTALLRYPTVRSLAGHVTTLLRSPGREASVAHEGLPADAAREARHYVAPHDAPGAIAVVGMMLRGPGVRDIRDLWPLLHDSRDAITRYPDPEGAVRDPSSNFVRAEGSLDDAEAFDAEFFGMTGADAALMDPQHRVFMESSWAALEDAGYDPRRYPGRIAVFAGAGAPRYWMGPVARTLSRGHSDTLAYRAELHNAAEFLTTRTAFKLGLRGPAATIQTACSSSLAAVHVARNALLAGDCDMALAGGVSIASFDGDERGYVAAEGGILSLSGRCRPFSDAADGTVKASGVALVVLKRLADAKRDGDTVHAVIRGSAMNNDGSDKIGFSAPSEDGQVRMLEAAYANAGLDPACVSFIQAHGTGTALGDAVEVAALQRVFTGRDLGARISLTSVKANLGHLDAAAGTAGLIAAVLALEHRVVPGMPGFTAPNPDLHVEESALTLHAGPRPIGGPDDQALFAGVSAFGMGGTNVHVVLQSAPSSEPEPRRGHVPGARLLCVSARTAAALGHSIAGLDRFLGDPSSAPDLPELGDVAYTLAVGRAHHAHRAVRVVTDSGERGPVRAEDWVSAQASSVPRLAFLFPGQGAQLPNMARELYRAHSAFRAELDGALALLRRRTGLDLSAHLLETSVGPSELVAAGVAQPALFVTSYAVARLLMSWSLVPEAMLGHSLGEYVAACLAGVFSLDDALYLVRERGLLMESAGPGAMTAVLAERREVRSLLGAELAVATDAPGTTVVSGSEAAIVALEHELSSRQVEFSRLPVTQAYHSRRMDPIRVSFVDRMSGIELRAPSVPVVSSVTGTWLSPEQATSPVYWGTHLCTTMNLSAGLSTLLDRQEFAFVDVGPGRSMHGFLRRHPMSQGVLAVPALPKPGSDRSSADLLAAIGQLWAHGAEIDWNTFYGAEGCRRVSLPTYPFERIVHTLNTPARRDPPRADASNAARYRLRNEAAAIEARASVLVNQAQLRTVDDRPGFRQDLNALAAAMVSDYFVRNCGVAVGEAYRVSELRERLAVLPKFDKMFTFLLGVLKNAGIAEVTAGSARWIEAPSLQALRADFLRSHAEHGGLVRFLEHCTGAYRAALSGEVESVGVLYPDGTDAFYRECISQSARLSSEQIALELCRGLAVEAVQRLGRRARLLEVGAGHGSLTWPLVEQLGNYDVEYDFTDIGRSFLQRAEASARSRGVTWLRTRRLDLNVAPEAQGFEPSSYDIVMGFNAVHTARDTANTLGWLRDLLRPGGLLLLTEATRLELWEPLIWGLAPGFWDTPEREGSTLLHRPDRWRALAEAAGFDVVTTAPRAEQDKYNHVAILAQRDDRPVDVAATAFRAPMQPPARAAERAIDRDDRERSDVSVELAAVAGIWHRLLGVRTLDPAASFYDLGGDSLLVVQFLAELRTSVGADLRMADFARSPTLEGVSRLVVASGRAVRRSAGHVPGAEAPRSDRPGPRSEPGGPANVESDVDLPRCIVSLQRQGALTPFFCVHGIGGSARPFARLAESMGAQRAFYGIQAVAETRYPSLTALAEDYIAGIRAVQPAGPYLLGGWSFGAVVAHEMAHLLEQRGETVKYLVFFDAASLRRKRNPLWRAAITVGGCSAVFRHGHLAKAPRLRRAAAVLDATSIFLDASRAALDLLHDHEPRPVRAPILHFRAADRSLFGRIWRDSGSAHDWVASGGITVREVPGDHFSMLEEPRAVQVLAEGLRFVLAPSAPALRSDEDEVLAVAARFLEMSACGPVGNEVVDEFLARDERVLLFDSYDSDVRGFSAIRACYADEYAAIIGPKIRLYDPFVRIGPGGQAACVAAHIDATLTLRRTGRTVAFLRTRVTWALEKHEGTWKIVHVHYSIPVGVPLRMMD